MQLIVIHDNTDSSGDGRSLLQLAASSEPIAQMIFERLRGNYCFNGKIRTKIAIPEKWHVKFHHRRARVLYNNGYLPLQLDAVRKSRAKRWFILSNGRFVTRMECQDLKKIIDNLDADIITVDVDPVLLSYREKMRVTSTSNVAGFRRLYSNSILPASTPTDWPHHIFVKAGALDGILIDGVLPLNFADLVSQSTSSSLNWRSFRIGGTVLDLETEAGLLGLVTAKLNSLPHSSARTGMYSYVPTRHTDGCTISAEARIFGRVLLGKNVLVADKVVVVGPVILGDNVKVASAALIKASIIGPGLSVPKGYSVEDRVLIGQKSQPRLSSRSSDGRAPQLNSRNSLAVENARIRNRFRTWPRFSYPGCLKRIADMIASLGVLVLFAPVLPIIAIAIKLTSPGPVFFKHKRQGLHGREFTCLKFRTMIVGADRIQRKLRSRNQVDGPQFKIEDDPRVTFVGRFLRHTFIDEMPQFINILIGQMSLVGPRPSPREENSFCAFWRDARLSVRPGITGLWQIRRTRQPHRDFQEWIYYDIEYVRNLSFSLDLSICRQTAKKLITNFISQF